MCNLFKFNTGGNVPKTVLTDEEVFTGTFAKLDYSGPEDGFYFCASIENVHQWCQDCRSECPPYSSNTETEQGFDCDDFADCFAAYCRRKGLTNAIWRIWGDTPTNGHARNVCQCPDGKYEIEPQTGEVWVFGSDPNFKARCIK